MARVALEFNSQEVDELKLALAIKNGRGKMPSTATCIDYSIDYTPFEQQNISAVFGMKSSLFRDLVDLIIDGPDNERVDRRDYQQGVIGDLEFYLDVRKVNDSF